MQMVLVLEVVIIHNVQLSQSRYGGSCFSVFPLSSFPSQVIYLSLGVENSSVIAQWGMSDLLVSALASGLFIPGKLVLGECKLTQYSLGVWFIGGY